MNPSPTICRFLSISVVVLATAKFAGAELVANPGFETGNFSSWTVTQAAFGSSLDIGVGPVAHNGQYYARFGAYQGQFDSISQNLATTPGGSYDFSFWLRTGGFTGTTNEFRATFGGVTVLDLVNMPGNGTWTEYTFTGLSGAGSLTALQFDGFNEAGDNESRGGIYLDDVSVTPSEAAVPELSTWAAAVLTTWYIAFLIFRRRRIG